MLIVCQVWNGDFPHVRTQCGNHLFVPTKSISNRSHCSLVTARFLCFQPNRSKALETEKNLVKMWQTHFLAITDAACVPFSASAMCAMWRRTSASSGVQVGLQLVEHVSLHVPVLAAPTWHFIVWKLFRCVASKAIRSKCCTAANHVFPDCTGFWTMDHCNAHAGLQLYKDMRSAARVSAPAQSTHLPAAWAYNPWPSSASAPRTYTPLSVASPPQGSATATSSLINTSVPAVAPATPPKTAMPCAAGVSTGAALSKEGSPYSYPSAQQSSRATLKRLLREVTTRPPPAFSQLDA